MASDIRLLIYDSSVTAAPAMFIYALYILLHALMKDESQAHSLSMILPWDCNEKPLFCDQRNACESRLPYYSRRLLLRAHGSRRSGAPKTYYGVVRSGSLSLTVSGKSVEARMQRESFTACLSRLMHMHERSIGKGLMAAITSQELDSLYNGCLR